MTFLEDKTYITMIIQMIVLISKKNLMFFSYTEKCFSDEDSLA